MVLSVSSAQIPDQEDDRISLHPESRIRLGPDKDRGESLEDCLPDYFLRRIGEENRACLKSSHSLVSACFDRN